MCIGVLVGAMMIFCLSLHSVQKAKVVHSGLLKELPVSIRSSRLVNALLCELESSEPSHASEDYLGLSARYSK